MLLRKSRTLSGRIAEVGRSDSTWLSSQYVAAWPDLLPGIAPSARTRSEHVDERILGAPLGRCPVQRPVENGGADDSEHSLGIGESFQRPERLRDVGSISGARRSATI